MLYNILRIGVSAMIRSLLGASLCLIFLSTGCAGPHGFATSHEPKPQLFDGMGDHSRIVTTSSPQAQAYFNQALVWTFAFNHDEAIRSFREGARLDPDCAMCWWGIALASGPHINNPEVPPERARGAWEALQMASSLHEKSSPVEQALIEAMMQRFSKDPNAERRPLDEAYAAAMGTVWSTYGDDADVGTIYAESLMDLQPWDLWEKDGSPKGRTPEIVSVLETVLRLDPRHPGANHLYIHAVEGSPNPERANAAADRLRNSVPSSGHLVHMPSHIDAKVGRWSLAADQNVAAIAADKSYRKRSPRQGFYNLYMIHNHHMLAFASMMEGRSKSALSAAREVVEMLPADYLRREAALADPYMGAKYDALKRFGRWDDILREPAPPSYLPITTAMWRFTRGVAYTAKGEVEKAEREQEKFRAALRKVPEDALMAINPAHKVLSIADHMLSGEIAFRRGEIEEALRELNEAIEIEDDLIYMEPPEWIQPVRHTLGAVLVDAKRYQEAEQVYRMDLENWPNNGWSLHGLAKCLRARGAAEEASRVEERFAAAWRRADVRIDSSCLCVP